jgi:hypothetical protein
LEYIDVSDYSKVILKNWGLFSAVFRSKSECERIFQDFKEFRDATKHNRNIDKVLDHRAQAALIWLSQAMEIDLSQYGIV